MILARDVISALDRICTNRCFTDPESLALYGYDATRISHTPDAVVFPQNTAEIADIVKLAGTRAIPLIARGAGTGLSGGSVPISGGIVVSMEKMDRIVSISRTDLIAEVEPGVITGELKRRVSEVGLFYPPDPASSEFSSIGGNISENAGGLRAIKYGSTSNYVLGLEVVLPTGAVLWIGRHTHKGVVGFSLKDLFIGAEGTLGIITRAVLRLIPRPRTSSVLFATFRDAVASASAVEDILGTGILPSALEFMDHASMSAVAAYMGTGVFGDGAGAALLIEVDGIEEETARAIDTMRAACGKEAVSTEVAHGQDAERLWTARRALSPALTKIKPFRLNEDVVVPLSKLPDLVAGVHRIAMSLNLSYANFGHAGDGNIHVNVLYDEKDADEHKRALMAVDLLFDLVIGLGGTLSGEHGVGITKLMYITKELSPAAHGLMKEIKRLVDPNNIMNPGKAI